MHSSSTTINAGEASINEEIENSPASILLLADIPAACVKWLFGSLICLALPLCRRVLRIEDEVEKELVDVVQIVETAAEATKKVSSDVAEVLPTDSKLRQTAMVVEEEAEQVLSEMKKYEAFIHKVDEVKEEVEAWVERIADEWVLVHKEA
ncbi:hypothetical protein AXF42_Ash009894 [Apostasia shenzhenica]|uniref:Uncharacterized protein n=1 Tax=Apostasia shenzhenica TaxID=1088818 RepID=A0A2I0AC93_9ASPA|nr:hypothetical protein AXF42_Ash009894 [Apostasia shenzhenica]